MLLSKIMTMGLLLSAEGGGEGAGAGGGQPGAGQQPQVQAPPAGTAATPPGNPPSGGDAPVTRAEFDALMSKIDKLGQPPAPPDASKGGDDMPEWAKALNTKIDGITAQHKAQEIAGRKQQLMSTALAGVPDANRGLATLALEGLLAASGMKLEDVDVAQVAQQLGATLRAQHGTLFVDAGSKFSAIPKGANGTYDWSGVRSMAEIPPELISKVPNEVIDRIVNGGGGEADDSLPRNIFYSRKN